MPLIELRPNGETKRILRRISRGKPPCQTGVALRAMIEEQRKVMSLRPTPCDATRAALIEAGVAHCLAACGGCALTDELSPRA